jgi:hypothetical protein
MVITYQIKQRLSNSSICIQEKSIPVQVSQLSHYQLYVVNQLYTIANVHYNFLFIAVIKNVESQNIPMIKCSAITVLTQVIRIRNYSQETNLCKQHINHISLPYGCLIISKFFRTCIKLTKE